MKVDRLRLLVGTSIQCVAPRDRSFQRIALAMYGLLTGAEFLQIVRRRHATGIEETSYGECVAPSALPARSSARCVDRHPVLSTAADGHAELRAHLVHQIEVRVEQRLRRFSTIH